MLLRLSLLIFVVFSGGFLVIAAGGCTCARDDRLQGGGGVALSPLRDPSERNSGRRPGKVETTQRHLSRHRKNPQPADWRDPQRLDAIDDSADSAPDGQNDSVQDLGEDTARDSQTEVAMTPEEADRRKASRAVDGALQGAQSAFVRCFRLDKSARLSSSQASVSVEIRVHRSGYLSALAMTGSNETVTRCLRGAIDGIRAHFTDGITRTYQRSIVAK